MDERLNKVLARAGVSSRRGADRLIEEGRVSVNGEVVAELGTRVDPGSDAIKVDGNRVVVPSEGGTLYLVLNKPRGVVTTLSDPEGRPTIRDLIGGIRGRVFPVGRLDFNSEGLLLLTDDGELARDLMHPRRKVPKTYAVKVRGRPAREALAKLEKGVLVDGRPALPAKARLVRPGDNSWLEITVTEGRKHQVRLMLLAIGHHVQRLRRIRYGGVELGPLPVGHWRRLEEREVERLRHAAGAPGKPRKGRPGRRN